MEKEQEKLIKAVNAELEEWLCSGDTDYLLTKNITLSTWLLLSFLRKW